MAKEGLKSEMDLKKRHFMENHGTALIYKYNQSPLQVVNSLREDDAASPLLSLRRKPQRFWV
jgi:hypothetical protein